MFGDGDILLTEASISLGDQQSPLGLWGKNTASPVLKPGVSPRKRHLGLLPLYFWKLAPFEPKKEALCGTMHLVSDLGSDIPAAWASIVNL